MPVPTFAAIKTRAVRREDGRWVINGQKIWTSYAHFATHCIVLARTNLEAPPIAGCRCSSSEWTRPVST